MKPGIQPTGVERCLKEGDFIVSKTDASGRIVYGNRIFIQMSGYPEHELIGTQHNIIRHPDMPRGVFKFLWDTIAGGSECFAYVKNLAKDGSHYWVFANVTPSYGTNGRIEGYYSVRRKPKASGVRAASDLYRTMLDIERQAGPARAPEASLAWLADQLQSRGTTYERFITSL